MASFFTKKLKQGTTSWNVLLRAGQPDTRLGSRYTYCAKGGKTIAVDLDAQGNVKEVKKVRRG